MGYRLTMPQFNKGDKMEEPRNKQEKIFIKSSINNKLTINIGFSSKNDNKGKKQTAALLQKDMKGK